MGAKNTKSLTSTPNVHPSINNINVLADEAHTLAEDVGETFGKKSIPTIPDDQPIITMTELMDIAQTGDIINWSANCMIGKFIRWLCSSPYSHVTIVFRGPLTRKEEKSKIRDYKNMIRLFQATSGEFTEIIEDKKKKVLCEAMLNPLDEVICKNFKEDEVAVFRQMRILGKSEKDEKKIRKKFNKRMAQFILRHIDDPYQGFTRNEDGKMKGFSDIYTTYFERMLKIKGKSEEKNHAWICSSLVAGALQHSGVLKRDPPYNVYAPREFSDEYAKWLSDHFKDKTFHYNSGHLVTEVYEVVPLIENCETVHLTACILCMSSDCKGECIKSRKNYMEDVESDTEVDTLTVEDAKKLDEKIKEVIQDENQKLDDKKNKEQDENQKLDEKIKEEENHE